LGGAASNDLLPINADAALLDAIDATEHGYYDVEDEAKEGGGFGDPGYDNNGKYKGIVTQATNYGLRGKPLAEMSLYQYCMCVNVILKRNFKSKKETDDNDGEDNSEDDNINDVDNENINDDEDSDHDKEEEKKSNKKKKKPAQRKENATFQFDERHPQFHTHVQRLKSKLSIPEIVGSFPPCPAMLNARTLSRCNIFGRYILTILKPWDIVSQTPTEKIEDFGWDGYINFLCDLAKPNAPWYYSSILKKIENLRSGVRSSSKCRKMTSIYRARGVIPWNSVNVDSCDDDDSDGEGKGSRSRVGAAAFGQDEENSEDEEDKKQRENTDAEELLAALQAYAATNDKTHGAHSLADMYVLQQKNQLNVLLAGRMSVAQDLLTSEELTFEKNRNEADNNEDNNNDDVDADESRHIYPLATNYNNIFTKHSVNSATVMQSIATAFKDLNMGLNDPADEKPGDDDEEKGINFQVAHNFRKVAREHDQEDQNKEKETEDNLTKKLTDEQKEIFTLVKDAAQGKGQILLSVNNGPGTGKTTTLQTVEAVLALTGGKRVIKNSATTGAAATVFGPGTVTLHSALHISTRK